MSPIVYHEAMAAVLTGQKHVIEDYERMLATEKQRADAAEEKLQALLQSLEKPE